MPLSLTETRLGCARTPHADVGEVINYQKIVALQGVNLKEHLHKTFGEWGPSAPPTHRAFLTLCMCVRAGYDLDAYSRDVAVLFAIGFTLRMVALLLMAVLDRKKKM